MGAVAAIVGAVQLLGLDLRVGVHTGECERVVATVRDAQIGCGCGANLRAVDGTLRERGGNAGQTFAVRKLAGGSLHRIVARGWRAIPPRR